MFDVVWQIRTLIDPKFAFVNAVSFSLFYSTENAYDINRSRTSTSFFYGN